MKCLTSNEEFIAICNSGLVLVYNDFIKSGSEKFNILHAAWCPQLRKASTSVDKIFFANEREAMDWLTRNRGPEDAAWKRCTTCHAQAREGTPPAYEDIIM